MAHILCHVTFFQCCTSRLRLRKLKFYNPEQNQFSKTQFFLNSLKVRVFILQAYIPRINHSFVHFKEFFLVITLVPKSIRTKTFSMLVFVQF
jgi:hypothetical protein